MDHPRVVFMGSKGLGLSILKELSTLAPDALSGVLTLDDSHDLRSELPKLRQFARGAKLPFHVAQNRRHSEELLHQLRPDLVFVVGWYWLIPASLLDEVPRGFVGIHNSLLPRYRGGSPLVWALINGEREVGVSLFSFTPGMDDGPLWAQAKVEVGPQESVGEVLSRLQEVTLREVRRVYPGILDGSLTPRPQETANVSYCTPRAPEDGRIDWTAPAKRVHDFIRAQSHPYPGAFTYLGKSKVTVWRARPLTFPYYGAPGSLVWLEGGEVAALCGDHRGVALEEVSRDDADGALNPSVLLEKKKNRARFSNRPS